MINECLFTINVSCRNEKPWTYGATVYNYLNSARLSGMTGKLHFKVQLIDNSELRIDTWLVKYVERLGIEIFHFTI